MSVRRFLVLDDELLRSLYQEHESGKTIRELAHRLVLHGHWHNVLSADKALRRQFGKRGWPVIGEKKTERKMTEDEILALHAEHRAGVSIRSIARRIARTHGYANENSASSALSQMFRARDLRAQGHSASNLKTGTYVDGHKLAELVRAWVDEFKQLHPHQTGPTSDSSSAMPVYEALIERVDRASGGRDENGELRTEHSVSESVVIAILGGRRDFVLFYEVADPLVCAIGRPMVFLDGTLPVLELEQGRRVEREAA